MYICATYHFKGKAENEPGETSTLSCLYSYVRSTRLGNEQTQDIKVIMFFHFVFLLKIKTFIIWITHSKLIQCGLERGILGSRIPVPFQLESLIPKFCHRYAEYRFFPISHSFPNFGESRFPGSSQVPHPVRVFRIPHGHGKYPSRPWSKNTTVFPAIKWLVELHFMDIGFQRLQHTVLLGSNEFDTQRKFLKLTQ